MLAMSWWSQTYEKKIRWVNWSKLYTQKIKEEWTRDWSIIQTTYFTGYIKTRGFFFFKFFFQNNTKIQTILLVSTFSKLFSKLKSWAQGARFWCAKSSIMNSSSMRRTWALQTCVEGRNLDWTKKKHKLEETRRRKPNKKH